MNNIKQLCFTIGIKSIINRSQKRNLREKRNPREKRKSIKHLKRLEDVQDLHRKDFLNFNKYKRYLTITKRRLSHTNLMI
jgi:hypothetical protein